jgi:hypothetical protein
LPIAVFIPIFVLLASLSFSEKCASTCMCRTLSQARHQDGVACRTLSLTLWKNIVWVSSLHSCFLLGVIVAPR